MNKVIIKIVLSLERLVLLYEGRGVEIEKIRAIEDELIRLNQAADLAERLYVDGTPEEYVIDAMVAHVRRLTGLFENLWIGK